MKTHLGEKVPFLESVLFLEGISRAGKFLLANLLAGIAEIEPVQYVAILEHIPYLVRTGVLSEETAKQMLRCEVDLHSYEMCIGRNFNYRLEDKSAIFNHPDSATFLKRSKILTRDTLTKHFIEEKRYGLYILHETMPNIPIILNAFPKGKVLSITRNPMDLAHSWYKRQLVERWGEDPTLFQIVFQSKYGSVPWFASDWAEKYQKVTPMDRAILSILFLINESEKTYSRLPNSDKARIFAIRYEEVLENPKLIVENCSQFLGKPILSSIEKIFLQEKIPNMTYQNGLVKKENEIRELADKKLFNKLKAVADDYQMQRAV